MTEEDKLAAKLKGHNCLLKFKDGEELFLTVDFSRMGSNEDDWFSSAESYLNNEDSEVYPNFPASGISIHRDSVKYVLKI